MIEYKGLYVPNEIYNQLRKSKKGQSKYSKYKLYPISKVEGLTGYVKINNQYAVKQDVYDQLSKALRAVNAQRNRLYRMYADLPFYVDGKTTKFSDGTLLTVAKSSEARKVRRGYNNDNPNIFDGFNIQLNLEGYLRTVTSDYKLKELASTLQERSHARYWDDYTRRLRENYLIHLSVAGIDMVAPDIYDAVKSMNLYEFLKFFKSNSDITFDDYDSDQTVSDATRNYTVDVLRTALEAWLN